MLRLSLNLMCAISSCILGYFILKTCASKITVLNLNYPTITYYNKKYISDLKVISKRYSRADPTHYITVNVQTSFYADDNITVVVSIQKYISNVYRPTFIDLRCKWCDLVERDAFLGRALRDGFALMDPDDRPTNTYKCPHPPGVYRLHNMTLRGAIVPTAFAFEKGRIQFNSTYKNKELLGTGYIDFEMQELRRHYKP